MKNFLKKVLIFTSVFLSVAFSLSSLIAPAAYADEPDPEKRLTARTCDKDTFLGFKPWDCGVNIPEINSFDTIKKSIWTIVGNIATDITVAATYIVLGFVIYGGYLYIFAGGDPGKVATGKKALSQAFIGLAITMSASVIVNSVNIAFGVSKLQDCFKTDGLFGAGCNNNVDQVTDMVQNAIQWTIGIAGAVALIFVVYGAIMYITSAGDAGKVQKAKNTLMYSLIGLAIVALAEIITAFVSKQIKEANKAPTTTYLVPSIAITLNEKELHETTKIH